MYHCLVNSEILRLLNALTKTDIEDPVRETILRRLPKFGAALVDPVLAFHAANADAEVRATLEWILAECGVRDDRILRLLLARVDDDPRFGALPLETYGDPAALPSLSAAFDRLEFGHDIDPEFAWVPDPDVIEYAHAITSLGGTLTAEQEGKLAYSIAGKRRVRDLVRSGFRLAPPVLS